MCPEGLFQKINNYICGPSVQSKKQNMFENFSMSHCAKQIFPQVNSS